MTQTFRVALQGFGTFERGAISSCLRLAADRLVRYVHVEMLHEADLVIADGDHADALAAITGGGRLHDAVFVGGSAPAGAAAWLPRPIDPLAILRELDALAARRAPAPRRPVAEAALSGRALLLDDSELALQFLERTLQGLGLETARATRSDEALERLAVEHFDVVLIDIDLGEASPDDGLTVCHGLKRGGALPAGRRPPAVVVVSVHASEMDRVRGMLAGCDAFFGKPPDPAALRRALERLLADAAPRRGA